MSLLLLYGVEVPVGGFPNPLTLFVFLGARLKIHSWNKVFCNINYKHSFFFFPENWRRRRKLSKTIVNRGEEVRVADFLTRRIAFCFHNPFLWSHDSQERRWVEYAPMKEVKIRGRGFPTYFISFFDMIFSFFDLTKGENIKWDQRWWESWSSEQEQFQHGLSHLFSWSFRWRKWPRGIGAGERSGRSSEWVIGGLRAPLNMGFFLSIFSQGENCERKPASHRLIYHRPFLQLDTPLRTGLAGMRTCNRLIDYYKYQFRISHDILIHSW